MGADFSYAGLAEPLGSALDARADFLLLRQKKVAKEKATPRYAVGFADSPALLTKPGGCATRGCAPQTVLADFPRPASVARRCTRGISKPSGHNRHTHQVPFGVPPPLEDAEQRKLERGSGRALFEGEARVAQPPLKVSSGGHPAAGGASTRGRLFFGYFILATQKKAARRSTAKPNGSEQTHA